jgi:alkylation response protein AidB-like acyl-CoA dehydrogenase
MDFAFSDEQQMLLDSTRRVLAERYGFEARNHIRASADGWSPALWRELGELGLLSVHIPEADGGIDAGAVAGMLVANAIGEGLLLEPFLSSAVLATRAIATLGDEGQRARWLPSLANGELVAVLAHDEDATRFDPFALQTRAVAVDGGYQLDGRKSLVYHAPIAGLLLVSARVDDQLGVFAVEPGTAGVSIDRVRTVDDQVAGHIALQGVRVGADARLGGEAHGALQAVLDQGLAMLCSEAFGAMDKLLAATIEYSRSRVQFGQPIGRFQALQHRMAEMLMHLEQARSMMYLAATRCEHADAAERARALSAAKALIGQSARYIGQQAVQLHGGMGMTDELAVSHWFRRLVAFEQRFGATEWHLQRYAETLRAA